MRNQQRPRRPRNDLKVLEFRPNSLVRNFIAVHTFGGRGSPSF